MEENKRTELDKINEKKEIMTPKDYRSIFWRSFTIQGSWSVDKMMAYLRLYFFFFKQKTAYEIGQ